MTVFSRRLLLALIVLASSYWRPVEAARAVAPETLERQFPVAHAARLVIQNSRGDIVIRAWTRPAIALKAIKTGDTPADLAALPIDIVANEYAVAITSRTAAGAPLPRARIDYELRVPADIDLTLVSTGRGRVQIAGTSTRTVVHVENGTVRLTDIAGIVDAMTTNGDIDASLTQSDAAAPVKLETFNGDIRVRLSKTPRPHFQVRTLNGHVTSELPLTIEHPLGPEVAHDTGAAAGPFVNLVSVSGDIRIATR